MLAKMDLDGVWELHPVAEFSSLWWSEDVPNEGWVEQELPGQWQELEAFSRYAGKMVYRRNFRFTPEPDRIYRLEIGGVFYKYRVYLNNFAIGGQEGYFYPACYNITPYLRDENQILLEVESPAQQGDGLPAPVATGIFAGHPMLPEGFNPGGIWRPVRILSSGPAFIERWHLHTVELAGDEATLSLKVEVYAARPAAVNLQLQLTPTILRAKVTNRSSRSNWRRAATNMRPALRSTASALGRPGTGGSPASTGPVWPSGGGCDLGCPGVPFWDSHLYAPKHDSLS